MEVIAAFVVVRCIFLVTFYSFEIAKGKVPYFDRLACTMMEFGKSVKIAVVIVLVVSALVLLVIGERIFKFYLFHSLLSTLFI